VHVEQDRHVHIQEGNHRLRAAHRAGIPVPVEVKYFGNSQQQGLVFPVRAGTPSSGIDPPLRFPAS
jgi:hypothetical protein